VRNISGFTSRVRVCALLVGVALLVGAVALGSGGCAAPTGTTTPSTEQAHQNAGSGQFPSSNLAAMGDPPGVTANATSTPFETAADTVSRVVVNVSISQNFTTPQGNQSIPTGNGSGIVLTPDGYILTNDHVVAGSNGLMVGLGMQQIPAKIVGEDPSTDLAVIKISRTGLFAAEAGDPTTLRRGQWVIAVGSPFGLERTVTAGIVSALNRSTVDPTGNSPAAYTNLIQTDAAVNPGNSGGALATLDGKIVGVNTLTESTTGESAGVGLAIPFDFAMSIASQLMKTGHAVHPYIGVSVIDVDPHVATSLGIKGATQGALVQKIAGGGPAALAGIKVGDVIQSVGGQSVTDSATLFAAVRSQSIASTVPIDVIRDGKALTVQVKIGAGSTG
jgi:serine protease Do